MQDRDYIELGRKMLGIVQAFAPNGAEQANLAEMYSKCIVETRSYKHGFRMLVEILSDGLTYGNWPWINPATGKIRIHIPPN